MLCGSTLAFRALSLLTHPKAGGPSLAPLVCAKASFQTLWIGKVHLAATPKNFVTAIKREKCLQYVLFGPKPMILHDPGFWVVGRHKDIVDVDKDAGPQSRNNF